MRIGLKRIGTVLLVVVLLVTAMPLVLAKTGTYIVVPYSTPMRETPEANGSFVCDVYKGTIVEVTDVRNGYGYIYRTSLACGGWISMGDLETIDGDIYNADTVTGLMITPPDKLVYIAGEDTFDDTGMSVWAVFADGARKQVEGYARYLPSFDTVGEKTVYITYKPENSSKTFSVSFNVTVMQVPVYTLAAEGSMKREYVKGQKLSLDGLLLRVTYLDSRPDAVFTSNEILASGSGFTLTDCCGELSGTPLTVGTHTISVSYLVPGCSTVIPITVSPASATRLEILTYPYNTEIFSDTKTPELAGLLVAVFYDNGDVEYLNHTECTYTFDKDNAVLGRNEIMIHCRGVSAPMSVTMVDPALVGIEVADPGTIVYAQNESLAFEAITVNGIYESGEKRPVYGWTFSGYDKTKLGEQQVQIKLDGFSDSFIVYVTLAGVLPGDADLDEKLTAADARLILRYAVGLGNLSGAALWAADRNGDGNITADDARGALRAAVKLDPILPLVQE